MFEDQGNEMVIPSWVLPIKGKKGSVIADKLLGGFEVDSELPFKVLRALPVNATMSEGYVKVTMHSTSTVEDLKLTKECLQELIAFGFGEFIVMEGTT